jgi:16S rRNA (cytidine1402-2'-O)-methyltransferase
MPGTLYIVATPIGNLEDISARALRILAEANVVLAEDTRVTKNLFRHFKIGTPLESFHEYTQTGKIAKIIERLRNGETVALTTDAGTPAISDPGSFLVSESVRELGDELKVVPIPGPSAITAALSIAGFPADAFCFYGFLSAKKGRAAEVKHVATHATTVVLFEAPHRIEKTLAELAAHAPSRRTVIIREISKVFETIYRGTLEELAAPGIVRAQGEFVIVLGPIRV